MTAIGAAAPRSDADTKVRGTAIYGVDVSLPGMLHGAIMRSPVARGRIRRIDTTKAETMPGVSYRQNSLRCPIPSNRPQHP